MTILPIFGAAIFAGLGLLHLAYTLLDIAKGPRYFAPKDRSLLEAMRKTRVALAPGGRDYWTATLGFHLSHSIGVLLLALLILVATLQPIGWLKPLLVGVGALYATIAWRHWFAIPFAGCVAGTALLAVGWIV